MKKKTSKVIFIGAIDVGNVATNGETMKNQMLLKRFEDLFDKVVAVDAYQWRRRPWVFLKILWKLVGNSGAKVVISASGAAGKLYKFLHYVPLKRNVYDWVIGGSRAYRIRQGVYKIDVLKGLNKIIVEGNTMVAELNAMGLDNVVRVPNFKPVDYIPVKNNGKEKEKMRFVFLSRVHPNKGIKEIVDASIALNAQGYENRYEVNFYGPLDDNYRQEFEVQIAPMANVNYRGFLNLMGTSGYDQLAGYDVMLFPTYWDGEGFPGVVIDAYIAGLPIIASDWNMNREVVTDGDTGFIIPVHDSVVLADKMKGYIEGELDLATMSRKCQEMAKQFDYRNVVTKELLVELGLIDNE